MVEVEARIVGSNLDKGIGSVLLSSTKQEVSALDLIRLGVMEQIRELTVRRNLSTSEAIRALRRQYQTSGALSSLLDESHLDPDRETDRALAAFKAGTCLLFIDGEQIRELEQRIELGVDTKVQFLRLIPLAGG